MKLIFNIALLFCLCLPLKAQLLLYQDTYKGGVTSDGYSYYGSDYLQADTINFQTYIASGSTIRKAYLLSLRIVFISDYQPYKDSPLPLKFNNSALIFDSSDVATNIYYDGNSFSEDET